MIRFVDVTGILNPQIITISWFCVCCKIMELTSTNPPRRAVFRAYFERHFELNRRHYEYTEPAVATLLSVYSTLICAAVSIWNLLGYIANILERNLYEEIVWHFFSPFLKQWADCLLVGKRRYQNPRGRLITSTDEQTKVDGTSLVKVKATRFARRIYWWNTPSQGGRRLGSKTR